jgi:hypothetical protein
MERRKQEGRYWDRMKDSFSEKSMNSRGKFIWKKASKFR